MIPGALPWLTAALGLLAGAVLADVSLRLPGRDRRPATWRRRLILAVAAAGLAAGAAIARPGPEGVLGALLAWQLLLLAVLDLEHFWLPRGLTLALVVSGLLVSLASGPDAALSAALGAAAGYLVLALVAWGYQRLRGREGLGGGDAWMLAGGGAWVGWASLPTVLVFAAAGGLGAVAVLALMGRRPGPLQPLPFGVALAAGIWLAWLFGPLGRAGL